MLRTKQRGGGGWIKNVQWIIIAGVGLDQHPTSQIKWVYLKLWTPPEGGRHHENLSATLLISPAAEEELSTYPSIPKICDLIRYVPSPQGSLIGGLTEGAPNLEVPWGYAAHRAISRSVRANLQAHGHDSDSWKQVKSGLRRDFRRRTGGGKGRFSHLNKLAGNIWCSLELEENGQKISYSSRNLILRE